MRKRRHWLRGIVGGLLLGMGLGIGSIVYAFNAFGPLTPWIMVLIGLVIGIVFVFLPAPWGRRRPPQRPAAT
jgi:drug/metabolite transporter (DMT)-like permease